MTGIDRFDLPKPVHAPVVRRARAAVFGVALAATFGAIVAVSPGSAADTPGLDEAIAKLVSVGVNPATQQRISPRCAVWVATVYSAMARGPVWFTKGGARPAVTTALAALRAAGAHGLAPADYRVEALIREVATAQSNAGVTETVAKADVALTMTMLRFLGDLSIGRVDPGELLPHYVAPRGDPAFVASLRGDVANDALTSTINAAEPALVPYVRLKELLARYQSLATLPTPELPPLPSKTTKIAPGDRYAGAIVLHHLLVKLGDLPADSPLPAEERYTNKLAAGVERFQARHGLAPDGIIGPRTQNELNAPFARRVRQIELAMERLRWLPAFRPGPLIAVNIPSFQLWAFADVQSSNGPALSMPVIVGRAMRNPTPVFIGEMRYVEFSPYWNVPPRILHKELLPVLTRDPGYLARNEMEAVPVTGGAPITSVDASMLAGLRAGSLRLRQRPGGANALGGVKFVLPNTMEIFLHGTPVRELFAQTRRDFSHGCIRVGDPAALARFVLRDQPAWSPDRVDAAMAAGQAQTVPLTTPVPVVVFYTTAIVGRDGRAWFLPDLYGHDRALDAALRRSEGF